ncbi:MAG: hypothetical protein K2L81_01765 [Muribaculaceae bacterium]|nr:hypothetical protein [Muribaculaceae bacterium]
MSAHDNLKGITLIIGRDPDKGKLKVYADLTAAGIDKKGPLFFGTDGSVPPTVSRCLAPQGSGHCSIEYLGDNKIKVTKLKDANATYVNGTPTITRVADLNARIDLGADRYPANLQSITEKLSTFFPKVINIDHLKDVWDEYNEQRDSIAKRQRTLNILVSSIGIFSLGAGFLSRIWEPAIWLMVVGLAIGIAGVIMRVTDKSNQQTKELQQYMEDNYVCPQCGQYFQGWSFNVLSKKPKCPYCGATFESKHHPRH